ncbi:MAG TPA: helix-turn-helix domain-containing protein [Gammaproteobacteria bacterium]|nr:helix-turn-helix domain-containing protein [Gammaproteobacteria bacterium]
MTIADRIREAREQAGVSQTELARLLGVTRSACSQWESPQGTAPRRERLEQLATLLGVSFEWLATGRGSEQAPAEVQVTSPDLPPDQQELLALYRRLPPRLRLAVLNLARDLQPERGETPNLRTLK